MSSSAATTNLNDVARSIGSSMLLGHLKPGVTPQQAIADLNSIGDYLQKAYPKEEPTWTFALARPGLYGTFLGDPIRRLLRA